MRSSSGVMAHRSKMRVLARGPAWAGDARASPALPPCLSPSTSLSAYICNDEKGCMLGAGVDNHVQCQTRRCSGHVLPHAGQPWRGFHPGLQRGCCSPSILHAARAPEYRRDEDASLPRGTACKLPDRTVPACAFLCAALTCSWRCSSPAADTTTSSPLSLGGNAQRAGPDRTHLVSTSCSAQHAAAYSTLSTGPPGTHPSSGQPVLACTGHVQAQGPAERAAAQPR